MAVTPGNPSTGDPTPEFGPVASMAPGRSYADRCVVGDHEVLSVSAVTVDPLRPRAAEVVVAGDLCPTSASTLAGLLGTLLDEGVISVHVDLSLVELCTSAGVDALADARFRLERDGGALSITGAHGVVRRVLDITGVDTDD